MNDLEKKLLETIVSQLGMITKECLIMTLRHKNTHSYNVHLINIFKEIKILKTELSDEKLQSLP